MSVSLAVVEIKKICLNFLRLINMEDDKEISSSEDKCNFWLLNDGIMKFLHAELNEHVVITIVMK